MSDFCPVCGDPVKETRIEVTINDKRIVVCCRECAELAQREPQAYALVN